MFDLSVSLSPIKSPFSPLLFSGDLEEGFKNASALGYSGVDLSLLDSGVLDQAWIIDKVKSYKLKVYTISTGQTYYNEGYSLYSIEKEKREKTIDRIKSHINFATRLGAMVIIGGIRGKIIEEAGVSKKRTKQEDDGKSAIKRCVKYAQKKKITLLLEPINRYETNIINTLEEGITLIEEIGSENLRLLPDIFHMNIEERSIEECLFGSKSHIGYIHFADSNRQAPGFGHMDFKKILSTLVKMNFKGAIGIEILPKPDDFSAAEQAISYLKKLEEELIWNINRNVNEQQPTDK
jgi:5-keto-L-gluconate epimerase